MTSRNPILKIYRTLLRTCKLLDGEEIRKPLAGAEWGTHGYTPVGLEYQTRVLEKLAPSLVSIPLEEKLTSKALRNMVANNFGMHKAAPKQQHGELLDESLRALRILLEQHYMARSSSTCTTEGVRVDVTSKFDRIATNFMGQAVHVFTYRVRVINTREDHIKVLGRSWTITNERGQQTVHIPPDPSNAVVGQQPLIPPGGCFEYHSGTDINTPSGLQRGCLVVALYEQGREHPPTRTILAEIAPFPLLPPKPING